MSTVNITLTSVNHCFSQSPKSAVINLSYLHGSLLARSRITLTSVHHSFSYLCHQTFTCYSFVPLPLPSNTHLLFLRSLTFTIEHSLVIPSFPYLCHQTLTCYSFVPLPLPSNTHLLFLRSLTFAIEHSCIPLFFTFPDQVYDVDENGYIQHDKHSLVIPSFSYLCHRTLV
jgi:hypothetical protein